MTLPGPACFGDRGLQQRLVEIRPDYEEGPCTHHPRRKGIPIEALAGLVDEVFPANYTFAGVDYLDDPDDPGAFARRGEPLTEIVQTVTGPTTWTWSRPWSTS